MEKKSCVLGLHKPVIGMIHVAALPGTPGGTSAPEWILDQALQEAAVYRDSGIDALAIENMHDIPYLNGRVGPEITAMMSVIGYVVKRTIKLPCGIQVLAAANREALAAALAGNLDFVRSEGYVFAHVADEGIIQSGAGDLLRYRKHIGAENIPVFTDIKKKHCSHNLTSDVTIQETARAAEFFLSDGVVVTGASTGEPASLEEIATVKDAVGVPVLVGSGVTIDNVESYLETSDALIVGSWFKKDGHWKNELDADRIKRFMEKVNELRS